jgi:type IV secretion system protein VirD4
MIATKGLFIALPALVMLAVLQLTSGLELHLDRFATSLAAAQLLDQIEAAIPILATTASALIMLFAFAGHHDMRWLGVGVALGCILMIVISGFQILIQPKGLGPQAVSNIPVSQMIDPAHLVGLASLLLTACLAMRVAVTGKFEFSAQAPKRISGKRALHGNADWMPMRAAQDLFKESGGIVIGEAYRVDKDRTSGQGFRANDCASWGRGGRASLLCFDGGFGSSHGLAFAGSGGFKTTSVTIPTALRWGGSLIVLDPSREVAPLVIDHRDRAGREVMCLDPRKPEFGFNALDWIGRFGNTKEEDIAAIASWIMTDTGRVSGVRDDFFRASALQLLTAVIADVCLSGHTEEPDQTLATVRANLAQPEPQLRTRLQEIHEGSTSEFVRQNVAAFVNMTPETFSGVYANAIKETHWLSYPNYAALVCGSAFSTDDVASGRFDVFVNIDLKTLEIHAGLARLIIGSFLNAIYNRHGEIKQRVLFLLDEAARLGHMRVLETARDAGRKYGITLLMIYQSIGQLRETYGGRDASSKWFESASWISFAAINDPETAEYISRRCGMTTVEVDQTSRSFQARGSARTRSKQLAARPLILPHEVLLMRTDEQIVFTAGNPPLRCGRAIWFRRSDMQNCLATAATASVTTS